MKPVASIHQPTNSLCWEMFMYEINVSRCSRRAIDIHIEKIDGSDGIKTVPCQSL
jgi:hypothetical protein